MNLNLDERNAEKARLELTKHFYKSEFVIF